MIKETYATEELRDMMPYVLFFDGAVLAVSVIAGIFAGFNWRVYTGLLTGNALMLANFVLIGVTADKVVKSRDFRRGRFIANLSYGLRYVGIFVILAGLLTLEAIELIPAVVPLFFPKLYYTFIYLNKNSRKEEQDNDRN